MENRVVKRVSSRIQGERITQMVQVALQLDPDSWLCDLDALGRQLEFDVGCELHQQRQKRQLLMRLRRR